MISEVVVAEPCDQERAFISITCFPLERCHCTLTSFDRSEQQERWIPPEIAAFSQIQTLSYGMC